MRNLYNPHDPPLGPHPAHPSAVLPKHANGHSVHPVDLNPMDFIEHDVVVTAPSHAAVAAGGGQAHFDLDAFDMLGEFSPPGSEYMSPNVLGGAGKAPPHHGRELVHVADYSPEWAWAEVSQSAQTDSLLNFGGAMTTSPARLYFSSMRFRTKLQS